MVIKYGLIHLVYTVGVTHPENAFDSDPSTVAVIPWYWGEGGHEDFLHFMIY